MLDENLNWRLKRDLIGHDVESVPLMGWVGIQNGFLLRRAVDSGFEILLTVDSDRVDLQDRSGFAIATFIR